MRGRSAIFLLVVVVSFVAGFMRPRAQEPKVLPHVEAINLYWSDDYEQVYEALEIFNTVIVEQPDNVEALAYRAALNEGRYYDPEAATADYEQALALDPDSELVSALQAFAALEIEDFEVARSKAEAAAKSGHPIAAFVLGRLASNDKDYEGALEYYTQALKDNIGLYANFTARLYAERGEAFYRLWRFEEALADAALSLELAPRKLPRAGRAEPCLMEH